MKIHNTLTRAFDTVTPLSDNNIKLYTCGLTVYSQPHIGNWVAYIYWDILVRSLLESGYSVERVQNITDVGHLTSDEDAGEDKMLKGALKEGLTAWQVAEKYIAIADDEAYTKLRLLRPDHMPRATDYIPQQIAFIEELQKRGFTYKATDGIYFDTSKLAQYGELARLDIEGLQFGARVEDTGKKNPTDFALWKLSPADQKRDMEWESPWGTGFPGWHLECSVMAREILGDQIDIHTGGIDHIPVHHANEIAQTEAITGKQFSTIWLHANHIKVDGTKMSKSLGNIYTLQDITDKGFDLDAFKVFVLSKHYSKEGNFTWENLEAAQNRLSHWREATATRWQSDVLPRATEDINAQQFDDAIHAALENDLNTAAALQVIDDFADKALAGAVCGGCMDEIVITVDRLLGITIAAEDITEEQKTILNERQNARDTKDWSKADELRSALLSQGIEIKDTPNGQVWFRN